MADFFVVVAINRKEVVAMFVLEDSQLQDHIQNINASLNTNERFFVDYVRHYLDGRSDKILAIGGLRGTGKTTGLLQALLDLDALYLCAQSGEEEDGDDYIDKINKEIEEKRKELDTLIDISNEQDRLLSKAKTENDSKKDITIEELNLSSRTYNALHRVKLYTVGDLLKLNYTKLRNIRNLGLKSIDETIMCIHNLGYTDWLEKQN